VGLSKMELRKLTTNRIKKSQGFIEMLLVVVFLLAVGLFILILNNSWEQVKDPFDTAISSALPDNSPFNVSETMNQTSGATRSFDKLLPFLIIGLFAFLMISAGAYMQHPIMIFVGIIMFGIVILVAVIYSNVYQDIAESSTFTATNDNLPVQSKFMQWLPIIGSLMVAGVIFALIWSRKGYGGGGL